MVQYFRFLHLLPEEKDEKNYTKSWFNAQGSFILYQRSRRRGTKPGVGSILHVPSSSIRGVGGEEINLEMVQCSRFLHLIPEE